MSTTHGRSPLKIVSVFFLLLLLSPIAAKAQVDVKVSDQFHILDQYDLTITPNTIYAWPLAFGTLRQGDKVSATLKSTNDGKPFIVELMPSTEYLGYVSARQKIFNDADRNRALMSPITRNWEIAQPGDYVIALTGDWWMGTEAANFALKLERTLNDAERSQIQNLVGTVASTVNARFFAKPFNVMVKPCGQVNAIAYPDGGEIHFCTELLGKADLTTGQFAGIFYHEIGHMLLRQWGLPGWDQEDMADDFAVHMLLHLDGGIGMADELSRYFLSLDSVAEALSIMNTGDRHSLGRQRYENIQQRIRNPRIFMEEWNRLLYPHTQTEFLRQIVSNPLPYESFLLAKQELSTRP